MSFQMMLHGFDNKAIERLKFDFEMQVKGDSKVINEPKNIHELVGMGMKIGKSSGLKVINRPDERKK